MLFSDYNFNHGKRVSPFIGLGVGAALVTSLWEVMEKKAGGLFFRQEVGAEFFRHVRLTCYSKICMKAYNNVGLSIGYAFGGGLKKRYNRTSKYI